MENENITTAVSEEVQDAEVVEPVESTDTEKVKPEDVAKLPLDNYIDLVIKQSKAKYPEYVTDAIAADIKTIVSTADSITRISAIKNYRKAVAEYHEYDNLDLAVDRMQDTQKQVNEFMKQVNRFGHEDALAAKDAIQHNILDKYGLKFASSTEVDIGSENMQVNGDLDIDAFRDDLGKARIYAHIYKAAHEAVYRRRMAQVDENHSLTDDVIEQLMHDHDTIEASSDINKVLKLKIIDKAIEGVESPSFDSIKTKTANEKGLMNLYKEFKKNPMKSMKLPIAIGFTPDMINAFRTFFSDEILLRLSHVSAYEEEHTENSPLANINYYAFMQLVDFFIYHMSRICDTEKKRNAYNSIIFKMYILRVVEVQTSIKFSDNDGERYIENEDGTFVEREAYAMRSDMYRSYASMLVTYYAPIYKALCSSR